MPLTTVKEMEDIFATADKDKSSSLTFDEYFDMLKLTL
jgi:hypothetical protein